MRGRILVLIGVGILLAAIFALQARHPASGEAQFAPTPVCDKWDTCPYGRGIVAYIFRGNLPLETAIERADVIALIEVEEVMPARFNTSDGQRPPGVTWDDEDKHKLAAIFSPIQVKVERYFKGPSEADHLTLYKLGGMVDDVKVEWHPVVEWEEEMRGIVFYGIYYSWLWSQYTNESRSACLGRERLLSLTNTARGRTRKPVGNSRFGVLATSW